jgi:monothiol glutaredoxin
MPVQNTKRFESEVRSAPVVIYMKGEPDFPMCGFSAGAVEALEAVNAPIQAVNVLRDPEAWEGIKVYSGWPTIPQIFIGGKLVGGCDIVRELWQNGELEGMVKEAVEAQEAAG